MPLEIEAKMKVPDLAPVQSALQQLGATPTADYLETNIFLDTPDRALLAKDSGLRIRRAVNLRTNEEQCIITHKGPRQPGAFKSREETELTVDSCDHALALLRQLGFDITLSFEKRRESWTLANCKIELDEMPYLGTFVEVEGPDESSVQAVRQQLELDTVPCEPSSYIAMLSDYVKQHGITDREIRLHG